MVEIFTQNAISKLWATNKVVKYNTEILNKIKPIMSCVLQKQPSLDAARSVEPLLPNYIVNFYICKLSITFDSIILTKKFVPNHKFVHL